MNRSPRVVVFRGFGDRGVGEVGWVPGVHPLTIPSPRSGPVVTVGGEGRHPWSRWRGPSVTGPKSRVVVDKGI